MLKTGLVHAITHIVGEQALVHIVSIGCSFCFRHEVRGLSGARKSSSVAFHIGGFLNHPVDGNVSVALGADFSVTNNRPVLWFAEVPTVDRPLFAVDTFLRVTAHPAIRSRV